MMKRRWLSNVKDVIIMTLTFPTAHYISGWYPVTRTFHLIALLITDSGTIGIGEGTPYWSNIYEVYMKALSLTKVIRELSLEEALNSLVSKEYEEFEKNKHVNYGAYLALESAVLHALFQCKGVKHEAELLGGVYRTDVPIAYTIFLNHPKAMARKLKDAIESRFKHVKFKIPCNLVELEKMLETMHSVKAQYNVEDFVLRADANECFSTLEKAKKALSIIEKYDVKIIEQPMPRNRLKDIAKLRKEFYPAIEIMLDESLRKPSDIELFAQMEVADIINFHPSKLGCLAITREAILKTQKLDMKTNIGSALMTEIGLYHYLNLATSILRLDYPLEEQGIYNVYGYSILREPLNITEGKISLRNIFISDLSFSLMKPFVMRKRFILRQRLVSLVRLVRRVIKMESRYKFRCRG